MEKLATPWEVEHLESEYRGMLRIYEYEARESISYYDSYIEGGIELLKAAGSDSPSTAKRLAKVISELEREKEDNLLANVGVFMFEFYSYWNEFRKNKKFTKENLNTHKSYLAKLAKRVEKFRLIY